jgi:peptidoglycan/LPS O-acetylase OafA/YrhL
LTFVYSVLAIDAPWKVFYLPNMHVYLFEFVAGMLVAEPMLRPLVVQAPSGTWWVAAAGLVFCRTFHFHASIAALIAVVIAAAALVAGLLHGRRGSFAAMLERPSLQALGRVSFSLYLFNVPILILIWAFTDRLAWPKTHALEAGLGVGLAALIITRPLAWFSERWVERPSVAAGRWIWSILRPTGSGDVSAARLS